MHLYIQWVRITPRHKVVVKKSLQRHILHTDMRTVWEIRGSEKKEKRKKYLVSKLDYFQYEVLKNFI